MIQLTIKLHTFLGSQTVFTGNNYKIYNYNIYIKYIIIIIYYYNYIFKIITSNNYKMWAGSSVSIAIDYGLDGPGSNPGGDEIFRPSRPSLGPTQPPVKWVLGLSWG